jgi:uncharacterized membrane protein
MRSLEQNGAALRATALLGTAAASVAMFACLSGAGLEQFARSNALPLPERLKLIATMGAAFVLAGIGGAIYGRWCGGDELRRVAHKMAPLVALGPLPALCVRAAWPDALSAALAIGAFVLFAERLFRLSFATDSRRPPFLERVLPESIRRWAPAAIVGAAAVAYAIYMSVHTLWMHGRFQTFGYDLGQLDNVFWSTLHGHPLQDSPLGCMETWSELGNHADLSVFFFLPIYAIKPGGPTLLVLQSCVLGLGAIPLYRFAARHLPRGYACVIALVYLCYPPMHGLQFYDFHMQPMAAPFILLLIDFVDERRYVLAGVAFAVAIGCREDVPIGLAILGAFLTMSGYRPRAGVAMALTAAAYFVLIRFVIMPRFSPGWFHGIYKDLMPEGAKSFGGVITTLISNPAYVFTTLLTADKLRYALQILVPLALLPLRRSYLAVSLIHGSILTLLTTQYAPTIDIGFQYSANFIPYIFPAAVLALEAQRRTGHRPAALVAMVLGTVLCGVFWGAIPPRKSIKGGFVTMSMTRPTDVDRQRQKDLLDLYALVPAGASLAMSEQEMPHVSRLGMRALRDTVDADYFLYGTSSIGSDNGERLLSGGQADRLAERPGLKLLRRKDLGPPDPRDWAARAHWRVSSVYPGFQPSGLRQRWPESGHSAFFHTSEEASPWIEFDLGTPTPLHSFQVTNRGDCCRERAVPLAVETSTDGTTWTQVAKSDAAFDKWGETLPLQPVRYVRFRALRVTMLHFASVEIR